MSKIMVRLNFHALDSTPVDEDYEILRGLLDQATSNKPFVELHVEGLPRLFHRDAIIMAIPDPVPAAE